MGQLAAPITAGDFLTPPELAHLRLAAHAAGRVGGVRLTLRADGGVTRVAGSYQQVPLRLLSLQPGPSPPTLVYLLNPTAGLLDGDGQLVQIEAGPGTRALVVGQSASRIHPAVQGFCTQQWRITVHPGAVLAVLPGPAIPFRDCRYYQRVAADLHGDGRLLWGDIWLAGRYARGAESEQFRFERIIQDFTVRREGDLIYRDRFCWEGPWDEGTAAWHFGGQPACGNLYLPGRMHGERSAASDQGRVARLETAAGDTVLRYLGTAEAVTARVVRTALEAAGTLRASGTPAPWLLAANHLAPNHWFTAF